MFTVELYAKVRRAVMIEGLSRREAAKRFGLHRNTITKMLSFSVPPGYRRRERPASKKLGPHMAWIDAILEGDSQVHKKQRHTARRIFERLRDEQGFSGGYTIVRSSLSLVRYKNNDYSAPTRYGPQEVLAKGYVDRVEIVCRGETIAVHPRSYETADFIYNPLHYLALLEQKTKALDQAAPLDEWRLADCIHRLRRLMEARMGSAGWREFIQVLRLMEDFHQHQVEQAVSEALRLGAISFDAVKMLLLARLENRPARLDLTFYPYLPVDNRSARLSWPHHRLRLRFSGSGGTGMTLSQETAAPAIVAPQVLLSNHLKALKLPTFAREYEKVAMELAQDRADYPRYLLRLCELERIDRERRNVERRIWLARFPQTKSFDTFDFAAQPSLNKALVLELTRCEWIDRRQNCLALGPSGTDLSEISCEETS